MVKILHAADFHLDSPFGALSEERARQRRQECRTLADRLVDYANDHGADMMLLSGDLFDGERIYAQTAQELSAALGRFHGPVIIAPGNHDPYTGRSPYARTLWPENVHIFSENTLETLEFPLYGCTVYGAAFTAACRWRAIPPTPIPAVPKAGALTSWVRRVSSSARWIGAAWICDSFPFPAGAMRF